MANRTKIENLEDLIKDSIDGELVEQTVSLLLPPGENYGSVMYKVDFKVKKDNKVEEYHAVAKCTPLNTVTQELFNIQETFKSEIAWYTTVIPTLKKFQKDHGVEKEIDFFQPFYGARISLDPNSDKVDLEGVILTQNLKYLGYNNIDRYIGFDLPTTYTILKDLATFHSVSIAIKLQNPELFDNKIKPYMPILGFTDEDMIKGFNKQVYSVFEHIPECQSLMDRIKKAIDESNVWGLRPIREPWTAVVHRDLWINNIMVTGGKDSKIMILDLQFPAWGSPVADFVFLLLTSVKLTVIQDKLDHFIEFYHKEFVGNLEKLNVSTDNYSFEGLLKEIETEMKTATFCHALQHTSMIFKEKGQSDFNASDENFNMNDIKKNEIPPPNEMQINKYRWISLEAAKRNWI